VEIPISGDHFDTSISMYNEIYYCTTIEYNTEYIDRIIQGRMECPLVKKFFFSLVPLEVAVNRGSIDRPEDFGHSPFIGLPRPRGLSLFLLFSKSPLPSWLDLLWS
jgi:hypothetical protein